MTAVKICGIKSLADALAAAAAGADYLGFNFYTKSPRYITVDECAGITSVLKEEHPSVKLVGVFVDASLNDMQTIRQTCRLDLLQLHGEENPQTMAQLVPHAFKAFRGASGLMDDYIRNEAPAFLLDASVKGAYGGTGVTGDWEAAAGLARRFEFFLAGGLNPHNVAEAVRQVRPWGVDVASGVEKAPGVKDAAMMVDFVQTARSSQEPLLYLHANAMEKR